MPISNFYMLGVGTFIKTHANKNNISYVYIKYLAMLSVG
jgi:hypothetical protein